MTRLIIAEKPDMGKKIAEALAQPHKKGNGFIETAEGTVSWCIGHIMCSYEPEDYKPEWKKWDMNTLPMLVDEWKIKIDPKKSAQFKILKELVKNATEIVNAGDPGREGQLIVDEVLYFLKNKKPVKRVLLPALDIKTIKHAFSNLKDNKEFLFLYEAAVCRGYADWHMGMNGTVAYTLMAQKSGYKGVLSVGRVQSPTLAIVVRRDEEIENFKPHDFYSIIGTFQHQHMPFKAYWKPNPQTNLSFLDSEKRLIDKNSAIHIANIIKGKPAVIKNYEENEGKELAPLPFSLSKMQIYASAKWGMSAKTVLDTCQALYEKHELQSYPRTDCQFFPENLLTEAHIIIDHIGNSNSNLKNATQGANLKLKSSAWNDKKLGEHYGLMPTKKEANLSLLSDNEKKIYQAVCERYIAQFYPACEFRTAVVTVECEKEIFQANGKVIIELGWRKIFNNEEEQEDKKDTDDDEQVFPEMKQGQNILCENSQLLSKVTKAPPRYTEGTLIKAMTNVHTLVSDPIQKQKLKEKKGIGQEATRTNIIETLFKRILFYKEGKNIISSSAGRELVKALPKKVTDPALTAIWEDGLDQIAEGKMTSQLFMEKQKEWVTKLVAEAKVTQIGVITQNVNTPTKSNYSSSSKPASNNAKASPKSGKGVCPTCGGNLVEKTAKATNKKFFGCSNWPKCNFVQWPKK